MKPSCKGIVNTMNYIGVDKAQVGQKVMGWRSWLFLNEKISNFVALMWKS